MPRDVSSVHSWPVQGFGCVRLHGCQGIRHGVLCSPFDLEGQGWRYSIRMPLLPLPGSSREEFQHMLPAEVAVLVARKQ